MKYVLNYHLTNIWGINGTGAAIIDSIIKNNKIGKACISCI
jgi:hypothetical protein